MFYWCALFRFVAGGGWGWLFLLQTRRLVVNFPKKWPVLQQQWSRELAINASFIDEWFYVHDSPLSHFPRNQLNLFAFWCAPTTPFPANYARYVWRRGRTVKITPQSFPRLFVDSATCKKRFYGVRVCELGALQWPCRRARAWFSSGRRRIWRSPCAVEVWGKLLAGWRFPSRAIRACNATT